MKSHGGYSKVTCDGKKVIAYTEEEMTDDAFKKYTKSLKKYCEEMDGKTVNVNDLVDDDDDGPQSSSSKAKSSSSAKSSTTTSSCDFKLDDNKWEYSYSVPKDAAGISTEGTVRYEFKGKDVTKTVITTSTGSMIPTVCAGMQEGDYEDEYEDGSYKMETTCTDEKMIVKTVEVMLDYEKNFASTKEEMRQSMVAQCKK